MRVVVNCSFVVPGVVGGTEEFSVRLLRSVLAHQSDVEIGIVAQRRFFEVYPDLAFRAVGSLRGPASNRAYRVAAESLWLPTRTKLADVTHHFGGRIPTRHSTPAVVTVHDIQPLDHPENFSAAKAAFLARSLPRTVRQAAVVCTPTRWVAERVIERLAVDPGKVRVVGPGLGPRPTVSHRERVPRELRHRRIVLFPGITHPHKNHVTLIRAMVKVRERVPDAVLVLTGGRGAADDRVAAVTHRVDPDGTLVRHLGRVDESLLRGLFAEAHVLAFPSRYEGFGLPVLEAMQAGTAVVAAAATCLPEVVGDAGVLVDVDDVEQWADGIVSILEDDEHRARLAMQGALRAEGFGPEVAASRLVDTWRACC